MKKDLANFTLYKLRYVIGYCLLGILFISAVTLASVYTPGGITQEEINSVKLTNLLEQGSLSIVNLPFHLLQLLIFSIFGVSILSIKLPAILLSIASTVAIFFLLRRWFKPGIAVLAMLIMTTTGQFVFIAQSATQHILYIFFTAMILLFASLTVQKTKSQLVWKLGLALSVALSWYTPYFMYISLGLLLVALIHPHTRYSIFKKSERANWFIALAVFVAAVFPLGFLIAENNQLLTDLLGYQIAGFDIVANLKSLFVTFFWIEPVVVGGQILPIFDFGSVALILLGTLVLFRQSYTSRTYMIIAWLIFALPVVVLRPSLVSILIIPLFILLAVGIEALLSEWYKLFPKNPYARGSGLVLIVSLVCVMVYSGFDRFANGYMFMPDSANSFNKDLPLLKRELRDRPVKTLVVVDEDEKPVYDALAKHSKFDIQITTDPSTGEIGNALVTHQAKSQSNFQGWELQRIFTNNRQENSDRLYLYKVGDQDI